MQATQFSADYIMEWQHFYSRCNHGFFSLNHHYKDLTLKIFEKTFCYLANFVPLVVDILITVQNFPLLTVTAVALPSNTEDTKVLS